MSRLVLPLLLLVASICSAEPVQDDEKEAKHYSSVSAQDFSVFPDAGKDMGPALRHMIQTVIAAETPVEIQLEPGEYRIGRGDSFDSAIAIKGASHVIIRGAGNDTEIILTEPRQGGFFLADCVDVWIMDLVY